jgi:hypothetical protein
VSSELVPLGHHSPTNSDTSMTQTQQEQLPKNLTLHVGNEASLLERPDHSTQQTELVLAPVELHRRNIQRRLRESQTPKTSFQFSDPTTVGKQLLDVAGLPTTTVDRIDRLSMIRSILSDEDVSIASPVVPSEPQSVEQIRTEIEAVTGFHPERLNIVQDVVGGLQAPINADGAELLDAAVSIEQALRQLTSTSTSVSDVAFVRRAARELLATDGAIWEDAFPDVERVSLVGVSSVPAAYIDLLHAVLASVAVPVHVHFRRGTGSYLTQRASELFDVASPGMVVFES